VEAVILFPALNRLKDGIAVRRTTRLDSSGANSPKWKP
jgi:hypothetical protein